MVEDVMFLLMYSITVVFDFAETIIDSVGGWLYVVGGFTIYSIYRFLLAPLLAGKYVTLGSERAPERHPVSGLEGKRSGRKSE